MSVFRNSTPPSVPAYLFRVHSPESPGFNTQDKFCSPAYEQGTDASGYSEDDERMMLVEHVTRLKEYYGQPRTVTDDYISFTPSLVWALQYAHFKQHKDPDLPVYITILRTADFDHGTFVAALRLFRDYGLPSRGPQSVRNLLQDRWNNAEWLVRGYLDIVGRSSTVTLGILKAGGLHRLYPEYQGSEHHGKLAMRVEELRSQWRGEVNIASTTPSHIRPYAVTDNEEDLADKLSNFFGPDFSVIMTIWFLAMKRRSKTDLIVEPEHLPCLDAAYTMNTPASPWPSALLDLHQFEALVLQVRRNTKRLAVVGNAIKASTPQRQTETRDDEERVDGELVDLTSRLGTVHLA